MTADVRVLGVRHHGPGSARSVLAALKQWQPDRILIEGPPEADSLVALVGDAELVPPVAVLAYQNDDPAMASFWPFAVFSPEWQALRWAVDNAVPVSFMDLSAAELLAARAAEVAAESVADDSDADESDADAPPTRMRTDPLALLAAAAGEDDPERWWEDVVEARGNTGEEHDALEPFAAVLEAMSAVRESEPETDERTLRREAQMRKVLRATLRSDAERIAIVCGAWHAPALHGKLPTATADNELLRKAPTVKVTATWVPWTHSRLATASGYGAGVTSPGWYRHLFTSATHPVERWMTEAAGVLRSHDIPTSTAHVIESVRLAETLAALRGRPSPGLVEVTDATLAVLCEGNLPSLSLVQREAVVGEALGTVPESAPMVPLDADLRATAKTLRLKFEAVAKEITLDLRAERDLQKSELLHRLTILGVNWASEAQVSGTGTFKEGWVLLWRPELSVNVIEASLWGNTVPAAAANKLTSEADSLPRCTQAVSDAIYAGLPEAMPALLARLDRFAAGTADVSLLLEALPALVHAARYGTVRGTDTDAVAGVAQALLVRICAGLPTAVGGLGEDATVSICTFIERVHHAVPLIPEGPEREGWYAALLAVTERGDVPPLLAGRIVRLLMDAGRLTSEEAATRLHAALSVGSTAIEKAQWAEGFTAGGALLLIHDDVLLSVLDAWVRSLSDEEFIDTVPLLRRGFGEFAPAERGNLLQAVRTLSGQASSTASELTIDLTRAAPVLRTARLLLARSQGAA